MWSVVAVCFNCGKADHSVRDCVAPRDETAIRINSALFREYNSVAGRGGSGGDRSAQSHTRYHAATAMSSVPPAVRVGNADSSTMANGSYIEVITDFVELKKSATTAVTSSHENNYDTRSSSKRPRDEPPQGVDSHSRSSSGRSRNNDRGAGDDDDNDRGRERNHHRSYDQRGGGDNRDRDRGDNRDRDRVHQGRHAQSDNKSDAYRDLEQWRQRAAAHAYAASHASLRVPSPPPICPSIPLHYPTASSFRRDVLTVPLLSSTQHPYSSSALPADSGMFYVPPFPTGPAHSSGLLPTIPTHPPPHFAGREAYNYGVSSGERTREFSRADDYHRSQLEPDSNNNTTRTQSWRDPSSSFVSFFFFFRNFFGLSPFFFPVPFFFVSHQIMLYIFFRSSPTLSHINYAVISFFAKIVSHHIAVFRLLSPNSVSHQMLYFPCYHQTYLTSCCLYFVV